MNNAATISDAGIFLILAASILIDMCNLFPMWIGDRLAFIGYLASIATGFKNSGLFELIRGFVDGVAAAPKGLWDIPITRGLALVGPQVLAGIVLLVTLGAMWPNRGGGAMGPTKGPPGMGPPGMSGRSMLGTFTQIEFSALATKDLRSLFRRVFPGKVNLGMVALAVLFIVSASLAESGIASLMNWLIATDVNTAAHLISPLQAKVAT